MDPRHRLRAGTLAVTLACLLAACETPIHNARASRLTQTLPPAPKVEPRALALALKLTEDGQGLTAESLREANAMLTQQGRIGTQNLSLTPYTERGSAFAQRLVEALMASGARRPELLPRPTAGEQQEAAAANAWDLELESTALLVAAPDCTVARPGDWMVHPYSGVGALGCATRANISAMLSDPRDLTRPRQLDGADGSAAALAVERYQTGEIRELVDIDFNNDN